MVPNGIVVVVKLLHAFSVYRVDESKADRSRVVRGRSSIGDCDGACTRQFGRSEPMQETQPKQQLQ